MALLIHGITHSWWHYSWHHSLMVALLLASLTHGGTTRGITHSWWHYSQRHHFLLNVILNEAQRSSRRCTTHKSASPTTSLLPANLASAPTAEHQRCSTSNNCAACVQQHQRCGMGTNNTTAWAPTAHKHHQQRYGTCPVAVHEGHVPAERASEGSHLPDHPTVNPLQQLLHPAAQLSTQLSSWRSS